MHMAIENLKTIYRKTLGTYWPTSVLRKEIEKGWSILDVGCGYASPLSKIPKTSFRVGMDFFKQYIDRSSAKKIHDHYVVGKGDSLPFRSKSFDCVIALEVIEHLDKYMGQKMIMELERVAKKKIILTTPNGFLDTKPGPFDNPVECHLSGWHKNDLKSMSFKVYGLGGLKTIWTIRHGKAVPKINIPIIGSFLVDITSFAVYNRPSLSFDLLGIKTLEDSSRKNTDE